MLYDPLGELLAKKPNVINVKCGSPNCRRSVRTTPNELFFFVPFEQKSRLKWVKNLKIDSFPRLFKEILSDNKNIFSCEDHFLVEYDKPQPSEFLNFMDAYNPVYKNEWGRKRKATEVSSNNSMDLNLENELSDSKDCPLPGSQSANGLKATRQHFTENENKFSFNDETSHIAIKEENTLTCDYCFEHFLENNALQLHVRENHLDIKPETFQCNKCSAAFVDEAKMLEHLENAHNSLDHADKSHIPEDSLPRNEDIKKEGIYCSSLYNIQDDSVFFKPKLFECYECSRTYLYEEDISAHVIVTNHCRYKPQAICLASIMAKECVAKKQSVPVSTFLITKQPILSGPSDIQNTSHPTCIELKDPSILRTILEESSSLPSLLNDTLCTNNDKNVKLLLNKEPPTLLNDTLWTNNDQNFEHLLNNEYISCNSQLTLGSKTINKHFSSKERDNSKGADRPYSDNTVKEVNITSKKKCNNFMSVLENNEYTSHNSYSTLGNKTSSEHFSRRESDNNKGVDRPCSPHDKTEKEVNITSKKKCNNFMSVLENNEYTSNNSYSTLGNKTSYEHFSTRESDNNKGVDRPCSPHKTEKEVNKMSQKKSSNYISVFENFLSNKVTKETLVKEVISSEFKINCKTCLKNFSIEEHAILHAQYCTDKFKQAKMGIYLFSSRAGQTKVKNKKENKNRKKLKNSDSCIDSVIFAAYTCINCSRTGVQKTVSEQFYCKFCDAFYNKNKFIKHHVSVDLIS